jgi:hypothetical protein
MKKPFTVIGVKITVRGSRTIGAPLIAEYAHQGAARRKDRPEHTGRRAADAVERQTDSAPTHRLLDLRGHLRAVDDDHIAADGLQVGHELRAPNDVHGPKATCLRESYHPTPHARVGRILYDEVTAIQIDVVAEQERRGRRVDRQHRELLRVRSPRQRKEAPGGDDHALAPDPARTRRNDPVAGRDVGDAGTDREHAPDPFISDD